MLGPSEVIAAKKKFVESLGKPLPSYILYVQLELTDQGFCINVVVNDKKAAAEKLPKSFDGLPVRFEQQKS